jgi:hypothetical protein
LFSASGTILVVGRIPDPDVVVRATVWTVNADGTVANVFKYDSLPGSQAVDVNDGIIIRSSNLGGFIDVPGLGVSFPGGTFFGVNNHGVVVGLTGDFSGPFGICGGVWVVDPTGVIPGPVVTSMGAGGGRTSPTTSTTRDRDISDLLTRRAAASELHSKSPAPPAATFPVVAGRPGKADLSPPPLESAPPLVFPREEWEDR